MNIQFKYGDTRFVVLCGGYAFKFARFYPFRAINRFFHRLRDNSFEDGLAQFHENKFMAMVRYVFGGMSSNLLEYKISSKYIEEKDVAKTIITIGGLINIQERGDNLLGKKIFRDVHLEVLLQG